MTKYDGIKKVETSVNENNCVEKKKQNSSDLFFRILAAFFITAVPFCIKTVKTPITEKITNTVKGAVTYDVLSGENLSGVDFTSYDLIKELFSDSEKDEA